MEARLMEWYQTNKREERRKAKSSHCHRTFDSSYIYVRWFPPQPPSLPVFFYSSYLPPLSSLATLPAWERLRWTFDINSGIVFSCPLPFSPSPYLSFPSCYSRCDLEMLGIITQLALSRLFSSPSHSFLVPSLSFSILLAFLRSCSHYCFR